MTPEEIAMTEALGKCRYLPGSYQKRFVNDLVSQAKYRSEGELSEKQHNYLVRLFHEYRNQHGKHIESACPVCQYIAEQKRAKELEKMKKWSEK